MNRLVKIIIAVAVIAAALGFSLFSGTIKGFLFDKGTEASLKVLPPEAFNSEEKAALEASYLSESGQEKVAAFIMSAELSASTTGLLPSHDTVLSEAARKNNNGAKEVLEIVAAPGSRKRTVMRFNTATTTPDASPIGDNVTLHIYICGVPCDSTVAIRPFLPGNNNWDEMSLTWFGNHNEPWTSPDEPVSAPALTTFTVTAEHAELWLEIKLPVSGLRAAGNGELTDISLILSANNDSGAGAVKFKSKDSQTNKKPFISFD